MAKNSLLDLNNHLFAQLERLGDEGLSSAELEIEVERSKAIRDIAGKVIDNASIVLRAERMRVELQIQDPSTTKLLTGKTDQKLINGS